MEIIFSKSENSRPKHFHTDKKNCKTFQSLDIYQEEKIEVKSILSPVKASNITVSS